MKRWWMLAVLLASSGVAAASPTPMVRAPDGWVADAEQASAVAKSVTSARPFTDPEATVAAEVYAAPGGARVSLVVSRATSRNPKLVRPNASQGAIEDLHGIVARARLSGGKPVEDAWTAGELAAEVQLQGTLAWHDPAAGTREDAQIVIAQDAASLVAVTGECVAAADASAALVAACKAALATLDPGVLKATRIPIPAPQSGPTAGSAGLASPPPPLVDEPGSGALGKHGMTQMSDGSHISLPPMAIPQDSSGDRRPVYVGAGIAILAAAVYWNRRNRERFEPEPDAEPAKKDKHGPA